MKTLRLEQIYGIAPPSAAASRAKRAIDVLGAAAMLLCALPLICLSLLAVAVCSPGNPLFSQIREGLDGAPIRIWKIRTMMPDAQERLEGYLAGNPEARLEYDRTMKLRHDPRLIPRLGAFLRQTSLDELPQLWNVLTGKMSLVGPRVMPSREVAFYSEAGRQVRRSVRPGITGLWQVMYRSDSDLALRERADMDYVTGWSLGLDLRILARTVRVVLMRSGAY